MNKSEKRNFVKTLCDSIKNEVVEKINHDKIPEDWNGFELRELLAEKFRREAYLLQKPENKKRFKEYKNTVIVNNL